MDTAVSARRRKIAEEMEAAEKVFDGNGRSRFFGTTSEPTSVPITPEPVSVEREPVPAPRLRHMKIINVDIQVVEQEAGYRSPTFSTAPFVSSPVKTTEDDTQPSVLETLVTTPAATELRTTVTLGVPETPIASHNSSEAVTGRPAYELSIDLEQIFSQDCEDAGVEETQLVSQGSSRAGSSFNSLQHDYDTSGHTTDAAEAENCGVSESECGVPESDVEGVVPREPSIELAGAADEFADNEASLRTEVIARGWRTRFALAAMAGRSAPDEEKDVSVISSRRYFLTGCSLRRSLRSNVERPSSHLLLFIDIEHQPKPHCEV